MSRCWAAVIATGNQFNERRSKNTLFFFFIKLHAVMIRRIFQSTFKLLQASRNHRGKKPIFSNILTKPYYFASTLETKAGIMNSIIRHIYVFNFLTSINLHRVTLQTTKVMKDLISFTLHKKPNLNWEAFVFLFSIDGQIVIIQLPNSVIILAGQIGKF